MQIHHHSYLSIGTHIHREAHKAKSFKSLRLVFSTRSLSTILAQLKSGKGHLAFDRRNVAATTSSHPGQHTYHDDYALPPRLVKYTDPTYLGLSGKPCDRNVYFQIRILPCRILVIDFVGVILYFPLTQAQVGSTGDPPDNVNRDKSGAGTFGALWGRGPEGCARISGSDGLPARTVYTCYTGSVPWLTHAGIHGVKKSYN